MMSSSSFEIVYDNYSTMLYGIALEICRTEKEAEQLLTTTFIKIHEQDFIPEKHPAYCITLIRLIIKIAKELHPKKFKTAFRLKQFENTPLINRLICDQVTLQDYCKEKFITQQEAIQKIQQEFSRIRSEKKQDPVNREFKLHK